MSRAPQVGSRVGSISMLATHSDDFGRSWCCKGLLNTRQQWAEIVDVVARSHHHNDADAEAQKVLLVLDALIDRQQNVELPVGELE
jgi:hypothetical protein